MIVVYMCVFFYSFFKTFHRRNQNPESRSLSLRRKRSFCSTQKGRFPPPFRFTFIHENHPSDIINKKCFPSLPLLSSSLLPARTRYKILFLSFSLCFPFFPFFAFERFAREGLWLRCFSLSRGLISLSENSGIPGGKSMDRHRAIFHTPPLPLFFRARLFAMETAEDFFS